MALKEYQIICSIIPVAATGDIIKFRAPFAGSIKEIHLWTETANANGDNVFNLNKNGTDLFSGTDRPKIAQNQTSGSKTGLSESVAFGDVLLLQLESMASGGVAANLTLQILFDDGISAAVSSAIQSVTVDPTTAPSVISGYSPARFNTTNNKLHVWNGTAWVSTTLNAPAVDDSFVSALPNITAWYAARKESYADGAAVTTVTNRVTGGLATGNLTGNTTAKPVFTANALNGKPVFSFNARPTRLLGSAGSSYLGSGSNSFSLYIVCKWSALAYNPNSSPVLEDSVFSTQTAGEIVLSASIGGRLHFLTFDSGAKFLTMASAVVANSWRLIELHFESGVLTMRCNGVEATLSVGSRLNTGNPLQFGCTSDSATPTAGNGDFLGQIAEFISLRQASTPTQKTQIRAMLNELYGV